MAKLGSPVTTANRIGAEELRVGPMTDAMMLTQADSIGLVDEVTLDIQQTSVDLKGLFPSAIVNTAITEQLGSIKAKAREFSIANLALQLGAGVVTPAANVETTVAVQGTAGANTLELTSAAGFAADDVIVVYPDGQPENVGVLQIASIAVNVLTFKTGQTLPLTYVIGCKVFKARQVAIGAVVSTQYFTVSAIGVSNSTGRPIVTHIWKAAQTGSMSATGNRTDFATLDMEFKVLTPAASEYAASQPLDHLADLIPLHPQGFTVVE